MIDLLAFLTIGCIFLFLIVIFFCISNIIMNKRKFGFIFINFSTIVIMLFLIAYNVNNLIQLQNLN